MKFRQMHLDFHTPAYVENVGGNFDKKSFQKTLKECNINAVTLFGRCIYGYCYYDSKVFARHPHLKCNLLKEQIDACNEIDVETAIYIIAGFDQNLLQQNPDWALVGELGKEPTTEHVSGNVLLVCLNNEEYMSKLVAEIEEVIQLFPTNRRIFLDIINVWPCVCERCRASMAKIGMDPCNQKDVRKFAKSVLDNYLKKVAEVAAKFGTEIEIFHNSGHVPKGNYGFLNVNTHFEMESLPTGGWGYDHFPLSAKYVQNLGKQYLGMTGRFHRTWGEFGGFKHPNALLYETSLNLALGAKCSIGDHLNYDGRMEKNVSDMVGKAYREVEKKEKWCENVHNIADIAILSAEAEFNLSHSDAEISSARSESDIGCYRLLTEGKYLFTIIDSDMDFDAYKLIVLPDGLELRPETVEKLNIYCARGGKLLACGDAVIQDGVFVMDFGTRFHGKLLPKNYFTNNFDIASLSRTEFVFTEPCFLIEADAPLSYLNEVCFDAELGKDGSTFHMPPKKEVIAPFIAESKLGVYVAGNLCRDYFVNGSLAVAETFRALCDRLLGVKLTLRCNLPTSGIVTLQHSDTRGSDILHLLYAPIFKEGNGLGVIRELLPLTGTNISLWLPKLPHDIRVVPVGHPIKFEAAASADGWKVNFRIARFTCHCMIEISYGKET